MDSTFAIVVENVLAMAVLSIEGDGSHVDIKRGMMVEIKKNANSNSNRYSTIMIHDYYEKNIAFENNLYLCKSSALFPVANNIWPYLIAIIDPWDRVNIVKDKNFVDFILSLKKDSFATVKGQLFNISAINQSLMFLPEREPKERSLDYECIVRYVGPIDEIGPGYYFGLELLVIDELHRFLPYLISIPSLVLKFLCSVVQKSVVNYFKISFE